MSERHMVDPTLELPDDTAIEDVRFSTRIRNVLAAAGLKTVGEDPRNNRQNIAELSGSLAGLGHAFERRRACRPAMGADRASHGRPAKRSG
jgi:hypothetical protein